LQAIKFVQQAVGLRGYAQRDPLTEYKLEGYNLFVEMLAQIRRNVIYSCYQFAFRKAEKAAPGEEAQREIAGIAASGALPGRANAGKGKRGGPRQ